MCLDMAAVLRDQRALGDSNVGMGNQLAINQLIAHHSVIFKPDSLVAWVSTSPWQLGKYVAYDLHRIFNLSTTDIRNHHEIYEANRTIPADTFLYSTDYRHFIQYQLMTKMLRKLKNKPGKLPDDFVEKYIQSNPALYLTYVHLGDYFQNQGDLKQAYAFYTMALHKELPGLDERKKLTDLSNEILKKLDHGQSRN